MEYRNDTVVGCLIKTNKLAPVNKANLKSTRNCPDNPQPESSYAWDRKSQ